MKNRPEPLHYMDDSWGIHIPTYFAQGIRPESISGCDPEDLAIILDPNDENYWDAWQNVLNNAVVKTRDGITYTLYQDGALWLIPVGMEWSDEDEWYVWPESDDEEPVRDTGRGSEGSCAPPEARGSEEDSIKALVTAPGIKPLHPMDAAMLLEMARWVGRDLGHALRGPRDETPEACEPHFGYLAKAVAQNLAKANWKVRPEDFDALIEAARAAFVQRMTGTSGEG